MTPEEFKEPMSLSQRADYLLKKHTEEIEKEILDETDGE